MDIKKKSLLLALVTIFCWGSLATFGRLLIHLPPFYTLGLAFAFGALPGFLRPKEMFPRFSVTAWGIAGYFGYHFFLFYSFRFAPAVEANLINYMWPVLMVLLTPLFFKESKLRPYHFLGAFLAILGCLILVRGKGGSFELQNMKGYLLAAMAAITWPVYSLVKKKMGEVSVWGISGFCLGASLLCFLTHGLIEPRVVLQGRDALLIFLMGAGPFGVAFYFWDAALKQGDAKLIGALSYLTPVLSTSSLVIFGGEMMTQTSLLAMVLIIGGASTGLLDFLSSKLLNKA
jgi:drug/metabolite transporter (DMT)-like permease